MKVYLAITAYNSAAYLRKLIPRVLREDFEHVFLLDDKSHDGTVKRFSTVSPRLTVVAGQQNLGPAGNRNRVLEHVDDGITLFLDADVTLTTTKVVPAAKRLMANPRTAVVGGLILTKAGNWYPWNYGPEASPMLDSAYWILVKLLDQYPRDKNITEFIRQYAPNLLGSPKIKAGSRRLYKTEVVTEANMLVRTRVLQKLGGFDAKMRYDESHDLCLRARQAGYTVQFSPAITVRHLESRVSSLSKPYDFIRAKAYYYRKHWGMSPEMFRRLYRPALPILAKEMAAGDVHKVLGRLSKLLEQSHLK